MLNIKKIDMAYSFQNKASNVGVTVGELNEVVNNTPPYRVYTALLTQSGTNAPVATVLENTLGGEVVWSYDGDGYSIATIFTENPILIQNKTVFFINSDIDSNYSLNGQSYYSLFWGDEFTFYINTYYITDENVKTFTTSMLNNTSIEIRVYN